jgi:hypothetical protein
MTRTAISAFGGAALLAACTFPEVMLAPDGAGGATLSSSTATGAGGHGGTTGEGGTTGHGGATGGGGTTTGHGGATAGGAGHGGATAHGGGGAGQGGTTTTSAGGGAGHTGGAAGQGGAPACTTDKDGDSYVSKAACNGPDCDDANGAVHPDQKTFFSKPRAGGSYDYDCNGKEDPDPTQLFKATGNVACALTDCNVLAVPEGYGTNASCGATDYYYKCGGLPCQPKIVAAPTALRCR